MDSPGILYDHMCLVLEQNVKTLYLNTTVQFNHLRSYDTLRNVSLNHPETLHEERTEHSDLQNNLMPWGEQHIFEKIM